MNVQIHNPSHQRLRRLLVLQCPNLVVYTQADWIISKSGMLEVRLSKLTSRIPRAVLVVLDLVLVLAVRRKGLCLPPL